MSSWHSTKNGYGFEALLLSVSFNFCRIITTLRLGLMVSPFSNKSCLQSLKPIQMSKCGPSLITIQLLEPRSRTLSFTRTSGPFGPLVLVSYAFNSVQGAIDSQTGMLIWISNSQIDIEKNCHPTFWFVWKVLPLNLRKFLHNSLTYQNEICYSWDCYEFKEGWG